jgi:hypothetical protein
VKVARDKKKPIGYQFNDSLYLQQPIAVLGIMNKALWNTWKWIYIFQSMVFIFCYFTTFQSQVCESKIGFWEYDLISQRA